MTNICLDGIPAITESYCQLHRLLACVGSERTKNNDVISGLTALSTRSAPSPSFNTQSARYEPDPRGLSPTHLRYDDTLRLTCGS